MTFWWTWGVYIHRRGEVERAFNPSFFNLVLRTRKMVIRRTRRKGTYFRWKYMRTKFARLSWCLYYNLELSCTIGIRANLDWRAELWAGPTWSPHKLMLVLLCGTSFSLYLSPEISVISTKPGVAFHMPGCRRLCESTRRDSGVEALAEGVWVRGSIVGMTLVPGSSGVISLPKLWFQCSGFKHSNLWTH